jgi:hypothetical protein
MQLKTYSCGCTDGIIWSLSKEHKLNACRVFSVLYVSSPKYIIPIGGWCTC